MRGHSPAIHSKLQVNLARLTGRLTSLGEVGALTGGGVCRLALSEEDKAARDLVAGWMRELGLQVRIDGIGNIFALRRGREDSAPVMTGSHLDTVVTGGLYDGSLGVLAGLEIVERLNEVDMTTRRPLIIAVFTNEEGVRFTPDMMGSLVFAGGMSLDEALLMKSLDDSTVGDNLHGIGYAGDRSAGSENHAIHAFVELHVEQGPVLESEGLDIGAVELVQGISWTEFTLRGLSNHAGTTPMRLRHDAGLVAAEIIGFVRRLAAEISPDHVTTVGSIRFVPNVINVIPEQAILTVDMRNADNSRLVQAERRLLAYADEVAAREGVNLSRRTLVRFDPVGFDPEIVQRIEAGARRLGYSVRRMLSGAGHDAQMMARICPTSMIFVPSCGGISHNIGEYTTPEQIEAGANVLLQTLLDLAEDDQAS